MPFSILYGDRARIVGTFLGGGAVNREVYEGAFWSVGNVPNLYLGAGSVGLCTCKNVKTIQVYT